MICVNIASLTRQSIYRIFLPNLVLADSTNSFKSRLDNHWEKTRDYL